MQALLDVIKVEVGADYALLLEFENGEKRIFDMRPYLDKKPFNRIRNAHGAGRRGIWDSGLAGVGVEN